MKKGAFEMSVGTMVIIVIAVVLLVLGLVFVRQIFGGASENVETLNEKVKSELSRLFSEDNQKTAIYLSNRLAIIKQGSSFGVAFAVRNIYNREATFNYRVRVEEEEVRRNCGSGVSANDVMRWITLGASDSNIRLSPGSIYAGLIRIEPGLAAPICSVRFRVEVTEGNSIYDTFFFDVQIRPK